ncbi:MAG TPA: hypothetical protein VK081_07800 [Planctomycetota bacterium]|nr:hypothetical protein [Planctomycetota bacterium]
MRFPLPLLLACCLGACSKESTDSPAAPSTASSGLPATLFPETTPPEGQDVETVKKTAKAGDQVVLAAQVGGRKQWQVPGKAIFLVIDPVLESCDEMEGDDCPTPWDFCCVPKDQVTAKLATVRVVGADGEPLSASVEGAHGVAPLKHVVVQGTVQRNDESGLVLDATSIWVKS